MVAATAASGRVMVPPLVMGAFDGYTPAASNAARTPTASSAAVPDRDQRIVAELCLQSAEK